MISTRSLSCRYGGGPTQAFAGAGVPQGGVLLAPLLCDRPCRLLAGLRSHRG